MMMVDDDGGDEDPLLAHIVVGDDPLLRRVDALDKVRREVADEEHLLEARARVTGRNSLQELV